MDLIKFSKPSQSLIVNRTINLVCLNGSNKYYINLQALTKKNFIYEGKEYLKDIYMKFNVKHIHFNDQIDNIKKYLIDYIRIFFIDFIEYICNNDCQKLNNFGVTIYNIKTKTELNNKKGIVIGKKLEKYIVNIDNKKYLINRNNLLYNFDNDIIKSTYIINKDLENYLEIKTIILDSNIFKHNYKLMTSTDLKDFELDEFIKNETKFYYKSKNYPINKYKNIIKNVNNFKIEIEPKIEINLDESKSKIKNINIGLLLKNIYA